MFIFVRQLLWYEDAASYDFETFPINTQFVDVFFIDVDADLATFRDQSVDVRVPYSRIVMATDEEFTTSVNHMVRTRVPDALRPLALGPKLVEERVNNA